MNELVLVVREAGACNEVAEDCLTPMIVQEAEVPSDCFEAELLQSEDDAKEKEVDVHNALMHALRLNHGEPDSSYCNK